MKKNHAFSLVELSIVLVILGLLVGGILAGQSLIRASELRSVSTEYNRYITATNAFRDKYFSLPGDMTNATAFWGKDNTRCPSHSGTTNADTGTCNGNGDTRLDGASAAGATGENYQIWRQLAVAGLIEGSYTGYSGPGGASGLHMVPGTNIPASKLPRAGWGLRYSPTMGSASEFALTYGNWLQLGADALTWDNGLPVLRPEEVWNIDTKLDDGKPGRGKIVPRYWSPCTNAVDQNDLDTTYKLNSNAVACVLIVRQAW